MKKLRIIIREMLESSLGEYYLDEEFLDEERITNKEAGSKVDKKENFVGSHTYGEDLGELGKLYVAYSYGEQHPLYVWDGEENRWYYNTDDYILHDGTRNVWTKKHLMDLRPNTEVQGRPNSFLKKLIYNFKEKHGIKNNTHTDLEPGEK